MKIVNTENPTENPKKDKQCFLGMSYAQCAKVLSISSLIVLTLLVVTFYTIEYINRDVVQHIFENQYEYSQNIKALIDRDKPEIADADITILKLLRINGNQDDANFHGFIYRDNNTDVKYQYIYVGGKYGGPAISRYWDDKIRNEIENK